MLVIRQENVNDYEQVYNVIKTAFEKAEQYFYVKIKNFMQKF